MDMEFYNKKISGLLLVVPENEKSFLDEMSNYNFPTERSIKLMKVMGYNTRRLVAGEDCVSDFAVNGFQYLFENGIVNKNEIDAIVLVTQTPDNLLPPTSNIIQGRLGLKQDMICIDLNQGCAGFVIGLFQAFMLLDQPSIRKVALVNSDVLSRKISKKDRNSYPLVGDATSIAIIERSCEAGKILANVKMDGTRRDAIIIPAGGMRMPASPETALLKNAGDNNFRADDHLKMDGTAVFNFVQNEVPPLIHSLLRAANIDVDEVDYFLFHQPNLFMLQKLAEKMNIPFSKMPMNVVKNYGNSSGATIPSAIALNLSRQFMKKGYKVVLAGFGVGLSWASMLLHLGPLDFCETIYYEGKGNIA